MAHFAAYVLTGILALLAFAGCATVAKFPPHVCLVVASGVLYCEQYEGETPQAKPIKPLPEASRDQRRAESGGGE